MIISSSEVSRNPRFEDLAHISRTLLNAKDVETKRNSQDAGDPGMKLDLIPCWRAATATKLRISVV